MMAPTMLSYGQAALNYNHVQMRPAPMQFNTRLQPKNQIPQLRTYSGGTQLERRFGPNFMEALSEKYGEEMQADGRPIYEDPIPNQEDNDNSLSNDDESMMHITSLQGERVDPNMRIYQVDKILAKNESLTPM